MPQSLVQNYLHIVYSTKDRAPFLKDKALRAEMHQYLGGTCRNRECPTIQVGGPEDHIHLLIRLSQKIALADLIRDLKRESSKWVKTKSTELADFHWQEGYGAFSVSPSHVDALVEYIRGQEDHHRRESFQDEFRRLCKKYGLELDERYAWD